MNWGQWLQGLIAALAQAIMIALGVVTFVPGKTNVGQIAGIAAFPTLMAFFGYIKDHPPPIGEKKTTITQKTEITEQKAPEKTADKGDVATK